MSKNNLEYFSCEVIHETAAAHFLNEGGKEIWIPKSQIEDDEMSFDNGIEYLNFAIPEWLAYQFFNRL